jgi:hypothetical protein
MDKKTQYTSDEDLTDQTPAVAKPIPALDGNLLVQRINEVDSLPQKAELLWSLPAQERHAALGALNPETIAALIETNPAENTALLGNLPSQKFTEIVNLASPEQGRRWLERAVSTRMMAAQMLPALLSSRDLMLMLMTSAEYRSSLSGLLNFRRAEEMRSLLHPLEWKNSLDDLLLADAEELLHKAPIRERSIRSILQSVIDFFPELYLEVIRQSLDYAKYREDHAEELADMMEAPFSMPQFLTEDAAVPAQAASNNPDLPLNDNAPTATGPDGSVTQLIPTSGDPFLQLATSRLPVDRRDQLEAELKDLLRREILSTGSFSQADILRAAGRLIFQIRSGLYQLGANTPEAASNILLTRTFADVVLVGARVAERYRQRALQLGGEREWLDRTQRQFLTSMNTLEPGVDSVTGEPALYLPTRANQHRDDWQPVLLTEVNDKLVEISAWSGLARAAFGTAARVQSIFAVLKTKTAQEAVRRTIIALCLYRRWEPELVNPAEDLAAFKRQFADDLGRLEPARQVVLQALDATPLTAWKPADAKERARVLLMTTIDQMQSASRHKPSRRQAAEQAEEEHEFEGDEEE